MKRAWCFAALPVGAALALALARSASAQETPPPEQYKLRVEYWRWRPVLTSTIQRGSGGEAGTLLDPKADLGFVDERTYAVCGTLQVARGHKLRASYTPLDYSGDVSAQRSFRFGATTYGLSERVVTTLKGGYYSGEYEFDIVKRRQGYLGGVVGAKLLHVDSVVEAPGSGRRETAMERVPLPVVGAAGRAYFGRLSLSGEVAGLTIGKRGHVYEVHGSLALHLSDRLALTGGYRRLSLRGEDEPDVIEIRLSGWKFGAEVSL